MMKNKYYVINKQGEVKDISEYRDSASCSEDMKICIDREAFKKQPNESSEKKPQYIINANKLGFNWEENSSIGFLQYDWKANVILRLVKEYARHLVYSIDAPVYEVQGSNFFDLKHPVVQAYSELFGDRLFKFKSEDEEMVMSYDASYPQFNLAQKYQLREKQLPLIHFSISDCYRYEQSGECMLLFRGRRFNMPDVHPYFKDIDQAWDWYPAFEKQIEQGFDLANRKYINVVKVSSEENWEKYKEHICSIAMNGNKEMLVEIKMDGADRYWIVDIDYSFIDQLGHVREIGCIQIDVGNAKRLGIKYASQDGNEEHPVIIHSAIPGGIERYIYMLIDNMIDFPIYFHPIQLRLIPVSEKYVQFAKSIADKFPGIRIDIDDRNVGVSRKIKDAHIELIPHHSVLGEREQSEDAVPASVYEKVSEIQKQIDGLPKIQVSIPKLVSQSIC
jgi:threonyl-tRNA synthetase